MSLIPGFATGWLARTESKNALVMSVVSAASSCVLLPLAHGYLPALRDELNREVDDADDQATQSADEEQSKYLDSEFQVKQLSGELHLAMAMAITVGFALGMFFLLIGDWTQKSSTELLADPWCQLIENIPLSITPKT